MEVLRFERLCTLGTHALYHFTNIFLNVRIGSYGQWIVRLLKKKSKPNLMDKNHLSLGRSPHEGGRLLRFLSIGNDCDRGWQRTARRAAWGLLLPHHHQHEGLFSLPQISNFIVWSLGSALYPKLWWRLPTVRLGFTQSVHMERRVQLSK